MQEIKKKGFSIKMEDTAEQINSSFVPVDFSKIKVGAQTLNDAVVELGNFKKINPRLGDKKTVLEAIANCEYKTMRDISNFFYKTSGIYNRLCRYMAYMYRYD